MSLTRPMQPRSERGRQREAVLRKTRDEVRQRAGGMCQWPLHAKQAHRGSDLCHGFRRGNRIGQPLCDAPELCWWGCRDAHDAFDGRRPNTDEEQAAIHELEWMMARDILGRFDIPTAILALTSPIDNLRWLERELRRTGRIHGTEWVEV